MMKSKIMLLLLVGIMAAGPGPTKAGAEADDWAQTATALETSQDWPELLKHAFRWTRNAPGDYRAWFTMGRAQQQLHLPEQALGSYRQALRLNDELTAAWFHLGVLLREKGEYEEAVAANHRALELTPELTVARYNLGVLYEKLEQPDKAIASYRQITEHDPGFAPAWHNLGAILGNQGQLTDAIAAFQQATQLNPDNPQAWLSLATAYLAADRREESEEALARLQRLDPAMAAEFKRRHFSQ
ncbi:tetratricopeptide repeat protein [Desulfurivibrio dismutans]|uniref:tetratricopeptide repeat protein n=1 Tax=Desulfurivibrio dismutans TaxID=1398908 RepID=UPI0023DA306A|nr:tetratricopeptide repeat protein [Desulfurivibrio alkaliphilus]MDF1615274.1 tetratricopeptide repeat protein [Desulfurivibrio alkaliphilus]